MTKELTNMTVDELRGHAKEVAKEIARREGERLSQARQAIEKKAREFGTSIEELFGTKSKPKSSPTPKAPKKVLYIDDSGKEWGRAKSGWTEAQKKKYKSKIEKNLGS